MLAGEGWRVGDGAVRPVSRSVRPPTGAAAFTVVSLNTALDRTIELDRLSPGRVHVARREVAAAGGKGFNVARVLMRLGLPTRVLALAGGPTGHQVRTLARGEGIGATWLATVGETRTCTILVDPDQTATVVNGRGPAVSQAELEALAERLWRRAGVGDAIVLTGSLPPGAPDDLYGRWIERCRALGAAYVALDASGAALRLGATAGPDLVKVNDEEFAALAQGAPAHAAARKVMAGGVGRVVVTRGVAGAMAFGPDGAWACEALPVAAVNPTGSGDAFLAGLLAGWRRGCPWPAALALAAAAAGLNAAQLPAGVADAGAVAAAATQVRVRPWTPPSEAGPFERPQDKGGTGPCPV